MNPCVLLVGVLNAIKQYEITFRGYSTPNSALRKPIIFRSGENGIVLMNKSILVSDARVFKIIIIEFSMVFKNSGMDWSDAVLNVKYEGANKIFCCFIVKRIGFIQLGYI